MCHASSFHDICIIYTLMQIQITSIDCFFLYLLTYVDMSGNNYWINPSQKNAHVPPVLAYIQQRNSKGQFVVSHHYWASLQRMFLQPMFIWFLKFAEDQEQIILHRLIIRHQQVQLCKREFLHMGIIFRERSLPNMLSANDAWLCPLPSEFPWS